MDDLMKTYGYTINDSQEWIKRSWTVRIFDNEIEAFDDPTVHKLGRYFKGNLSKIKIKDLLDEIEVFLTN